MYQGKKIVQPPYLNKGDKVALVSPAYWVPQEAIQQAAETIKSWGLLPVIGPHTNNLNVNAYVEQLMNVLPTCCGLSKTILSKLSSVREAVMDPSIC